MSKAMDSIVANARVNALPKLEEVQKRVTELLRAGPDFADADRIEMATEALRDAADSLEAWSKRIRGSDPQE